MLGLRLENLNNHKVTLVDYGVGNLLSVQRSLEMHDVEVFVTSDPDEIVNSSKLVLPGVGAFPRAMSTLYSLGLVEPIQEFVQRERPLLAICLGMQLLMDSGSEFVETKGLGIISGRVKMLPKKAIDENSLKLPNVGWSELFPYAGSDWSNTLLNTIQPGNSAYFVHSYIAEPLSEFNLVSYAFFGGHKFPAVVTDGYTTGCQFHPEKSGKIGLKIIENFVNQ